MDMALVSYACHLEIAPNLEELLTETTCAGISSQTQALQSAIKYGCETDN